MLWLHARTRFSQARAQLGLPDLDTDDDDTFWVNAENGEDYPTRTQHSCRDALMARLRYGSAPRPPMMEDPGVEEMSRADHVQARALRQKADGLEKVLSAIMDQCSEPPPLSPRSHSLDQNILLLSSSSSRNGSRVQSHPSVLPNGVRIRLEVGALINILFSRVDDSIPLDSTAPVIRGNSNINVSSIPSSLLPLCLSGTDSANVYAQFLDNGQTHPAQTNLAIFNLNSFSQPLGVPGILSSF